MDKHYNRNESNIIEGYVEAPPDYYNFSFQWISQAKRIMKPNASMYIVSGWSNLIDIENACKALNLFTINHIIWKYNFGVYTSKKFVSSHYHILYIKKDRKCKPVFNTSCRFKASQKNHNGGSLLYQDMEDVWIINKEYTKGQKKNQNKLPEGLVQKMIAYSSNENDIVCDFFMGNFTTAIVAKKMKRIPVGFELNPISFRHNMSILQQNSQTIFDK